MSIRTRDVPASAQIQIGEQVYPVVTQEDLIKAVVDGAIMVDVGGGCLAVAVQRVPTGVPNEFVTTRALVTWQDRTNAKPQPEPSALEEAVEVEDVPENGDRPQLADDKLDDGLRVDPNAVDESDVPASMRG